MESSLSEIAAELAILNPTATTEQITHSIIDTIESESFLMRALEDLKLLDNREKQIARFRFDRASKKKKGILQEKINATELLKRTRQRYTSPTEDSSTSIVVELNGAKTDFLFSKVISDSAMYKTSQLESCSYSRLYHRTKGEDFVDYKFPSIKEPFAYFETDTSISFNSSLEMMFDKLTKGNNLTFYDLNKIILFRQLGTNDSNQDTLINSILGRDIISRNAKSKIECIEELHQLDGVVSEEFTIPRAGTGDINQMIIERLKAVILHESGMMVEQIGRDFVNNKCTYNEYVEKSKRYANYADRIFATVSDHES